LYFNILFNSFALSGLDMKLDSIETYQLLLIPNYRLIIENSIINLRSNPLFIYLTKKIFFHFNGVLISMIPNKVLFPMQNNNFKGINLFWNKINTLCALLHQEGVTYSTVVKLRSIIHSYKEIILNDEKSLFCDIFNQFEFFCRMKGFNNLFSDIYQFLSEDQINVLVSFIKTQYLIVKLNFLKKNKKILDKIRIDTYYKIKENEQYNFLISIEDKEKIKNFVEIFRDNELKKYQMKQCNICYEYTKNTIKLNCSCKCDFCPSCIFDMRHRATDHVIRCPTCRKESLPSDDTYLY